MPPARRCEPPPLDDPPPEPPPDEPVLCERIESARFLCPVVVSGQRMRLLAYGGGNPYKKVMPESRPSLLRRDMA